MDNLFIVWLQESENISQEQFNTLHVEERLDLCIKFGNEAYILSTKEGGVHDE